MITDSCIRGNWWLISEEQYTSIHLELRGKTSAIHTLYFQSTLNVTEWVTPVFIPNDFFWGGGAQQPPVGQGLLIHEDF